MTTNPSLCVAVFLTIASLLVAQDDIKLPFYGVFGPESPELTSAGLGTGDIVKRQTSDGQAASPVLRGAAAAFAFPPQVDPASIEINSIAYANDVFSAWGPWAQLPTAVKLRRTTISFTVTPGSSVTYPTGSAVPICSGAPESAQIYSVITNTAAPGDGTQSFSAGAAVADDCGLGTTTAGKPTVLAALAVEPRDSATGGVPVYFTLSRACCARLRQDPSLPYANAHPCDIWFADGIQPPVIICDMDQRGLLAPDDSIDALAMSNAGNCVFSLDAASPTVVGHARWVDAWYPSATIAGSLDHLSTIIDQNTLIGFVPSSVTALETWITPPPNYAFGSLFLWFDPYWLGLEGQGSTSDDLNGIEIVDPPQMEGYGGSMPLRGSPGDSAQQRLCLFAQGVAGDGGGVVPVPARVGEPIHIQVVLPGVINGRPLLNWVLWIRTGRSSENTFGLVTPPGGNTAPFAMFFNPFLGPAMPVFGTRSGVNYALGPAGLLPTGTLANAMAIPSGFAAGSYTLQILAVTTAPSGAYPLKGYSSNCVQLDVSPVGAHIALN